MAKNYAISAGNPATLKAAETILINGGNAVDAAIAAYLASFVAEPCMASAGAGGFAMIHDKSETKVIDFFCQTPKRKRPVDQLDFYPVTIDFGNTTEDFHVGHGAATTPGAIAGIYKMHDLYGSIPIRELSSITIDLAKNGATIDGFQAYDIELLEAIFAIDTRGKEIFFENNVRKGKGDIIKMSNFADFLGVLAIEGQDLFYKGEIAQQIVSDLEHNGGNLSYEDFTSYEAIVKSPMMFDWHGNTVCTTPSPSAGGYIIAAFLNTYLKLAEGKPSVLSNEHFMLLKNVFEIVNKVKDNPTELANYLYSKFNIKTNVSPTNAKMSGTSHFNITDRDGMAVALTTSIGEGCGYFIPGTDMQMNNMLGEAALLPNGFHSWIPDTRLRSMMTPTMVLDESNKPRLITGSGGAGRIPFAISQVILYNILYGMPIETAVNAPRIHISNGELNIERGFALKGDEGGKVWDDPSLFFGGVHSISSQGRSYQCTGDYRRLGVSKIG